jgi:small ligand-binding sensory domain FIST
VADAVRPGTRLTFGVKDAAAARRALNGQTRLILRESAGAAPQFAFYFNCVGRGSNLYGSAGVDVKLLTERFPQIPIVGLHSAFEIAPLGDTPTLQLYTGVLALYKSLS